MNLAGIDAMARQDVKTRRGTKARTGAKARLRGITKMFGQRRVFVFYAICLFITVATMIASIITSFAPPTNTVEKMAEHVALCVGALMLLSVPIVMHKRYDFRIPWYINLSIAFMILAHFVLGEIYLFYENVFLFDKFLHLTGGLVIAACGFSVVYGFSSAKNDLVKLPPLFVGIFSFCFALALLVIWEIFEYYVDVLGGYNMQRYKNSLLTMNVEGAVEFVRHEYNGVKYYLTNSRQGYGLIDTMIDLIIGTVGAAVVSVMGALSLKKNPDNKKFLIVRDHAGKS